MTHVLLLGLPRADYAGLYCAASVLLRTRFLVWAVSYLGEVVHGPNRSATICNKKTGWVLLHSNPTFGVM